MDAGPCQDQTGVHEEENNVHDLMHPVYINRKLLNPFINYFVKKIAPHTDFADIVKSVKWGY